MSEPISIMDNQVILNESSEFAYFPEHRLLLNMYETPAKKPVEPVEVIVAAMPFAQWGGDNNYPSYIEQEAHKNDIIPAVLHFKANMMAAAGIFPGIITGYDKGNNPIIERIDHPDIDDFWDYNNKENFLQDVLRNLYWFHHCWIELGLNKNKTYISTLKAHDSAQCRYSTQNLKTGVKDFVYVDANWATGGNLTYRQLIKCLNPYHNVQGQLAELSGTQFIYPLFFNSPNRTYYQRTPWHSIFDTKWADLAQKIPQFKSKMMENQMHIKYVLHVPQDWWTWRYPKWTGFTEKEKEASRTESLKEFNDVFTGVDNAGKTLMLTYVADAYKQNKFTKWEVQEIKGNLGDGAYLEDSQEVSSHILFALAFENSLIGSLPGKGLQAGSGSDKRLADEIFFKNNKPYSHKACETMQVITNFNKWKGPQGKKIQWFPGETISTTLNNVTPANRPGA